AVSATAWSTLYRVLWSPSTPRASSTVGPSPPPAPSPSRPSEWAPRPPPLWLPAWEPDGRWPRPAPWRLWPHSSGWPARSARVLVIWLLIRRPDPDQQGDRQRSDGET